MFTVGDPLQAMVISVSADDRKIALSVKALEEGDDAGPVREGHEQKQQTPSAPSTLGDLLKAASGSDKDEEETDK